MPIYQLKANLVQNMLFGKITHHVDPEMRKKLGRGFFRNYGQQVVHALVATDITRK